MWAVKFEGVTKRYRMERTKYRSLRADVAGLTNRIFRPGHEVTTRAEMEALADLDLQIEAGTMSAIVGRNGAGKSTALRLISRITYPTEGRVRVRGRVGALIEVGAGVHPELSGRENIGLYGSFLGFTRSEIRLRFDDIVEFAEIGHAVDQAVKFYSTGMKLRLGFAIASFLEPAIFIVDESLAVGDGAFQAKCINRMQQLGADGTTIVFVSHELAAVEALCKEAIWLDKGRLIEHGPIGDVLRSYTRSLDHGLSLERSDSDGAVRCIGAVTANALDDVTSTFRVGDPMKLRLTFEGLAGLDRAQVHLRITDGQREDLVECSSPIAPEGLDQLIIGRPGATGLEVPGVAESRRASTVECRIDSLPLNPRMYQLWCSVSAGSPAERVMPWQEVGAFRVQPPTDWASDHRLTSIAGPPVAVGAKWKIER